MRAGVRIGWDIDRYGANYKALRPNEALNEYREEIYFACFHFGCSTALARKERLASALWFMELWPERNEEQQAHTMNKHMPFFRSDQCLSAVKTITSIRHDWTTRNWEEV